VGSTPTASTIYQTHRRKMDYPPRRYKKFNKTERRKKQADLDFKAQLEDFWHLLEKKIRLKRKELYKRIEE